MKVEVASNIVRFPHCCPCCLSKPKITRQISSSKNINSQIMIKKWDVFYCKKCDNHINLFYLSMITFVVVVSLIIPLLIFKFQFTAFWVFIVLIMMSIGFLVLVSKLQGKKCQGSGEAILYQDWNYLSDTHIFDVTNKDYVVKFMEENEQSLINISPEMRRLLIENKHQ